MMYRTIAALLMLAASCLAAPAAEMRCGWLENPTPGNWWLTDRDGSWTLATQGDDYRDEVMDKVPPFDEAQYVATNGNYGYGCACLSVDVDKVETRIVRVHSGKTIPLTKCEADKTLKRVE